MNNQLQETFQHQNDEQNLQLDNLKAPILGEETIESFIKESIDGIRRIEQETIELFMKMKSQLLLKNDTLALEDILMVGPIAKDYLQLLGNQQDNRTKILKAITDLIKTTQPVSFNNVNANVNQPEQATTPLMDKIAQIDPFENRIDATLNTFKDEDEEEDDDNDSSLKKNITLIHSPGYGNKK